MLSEEECQRVIVQSLFIWEASNDFFKNNDELDFQSILNLQQTSTLKYLDCLASKKSKTHCNESYEALLEISDTSYVDVCYQAMDYATNTYPDREPEEDNVIYDKKCALFHKQVQAILDNQPDSLKPINEILDEEAFEQHLLSVLAYTKFEEYGNSLQKLISMLDIQVLKRSIFNAYQSQM